MIRQLAEHDHLPDYQVAFDDKADMVVFTNRGTMSPAPLIEGSIPPLQSDTYEEARQAASGWPDVRLYRGVGMPAKQGSYRGLPDCGAGAPMISAFFRF